MLGCFSFRCLTAALYPACIHEICIASMLASHDLRTPAESDSSADLKKAAFLLRWHMQAARHRNQHQLLSFLDVLLSDDASISIVINFDEWLQSGIEIAALTA